MMKTRLILALLTIFGSASFAQKVNEKIQIESSGAWYAGIVQKVDGDKYFVRYDDWGESWDEWVGPERIKDFKTEAAAAPPTKFKVGDRVEVEYGMVPEPASIIEVGENKYHIKYDNTLFKSKWVTEKEIKKL